MASKLYEREPYAVIWGPNMSPLRPKIMEPPDRALAGVLCKRPRDSLETMAFDVNPASFSPKALLLAELSGPLYFLQHKPLR